jgi:hypothetical protein
MGLTVISALSLSGTEFFVYDFTCCSARWNNYSSSEEGEA